MVKLMQKRKKIKIKKKWDANRFGLPISKVITEQQKKELRSKKFKPKNQFHRFRRTNSSTKTRKQI